MPGPAFVPLAERTVDAVLSHDPRLASDVGDHRFDDRLPDFSTDAVRARQAMLAGAAVALSGVDTHGLGVAERVDYEALMWVVDREIFALTEIREHEWNPLLHNPGALLHGLITRPFAPAAQRLGSLAARLAAIPDALGTARAVLEHCPRIHLETAVGQFLGTAALVRDELPALLAQAPGLAATTEPVARDAVVALEAFAAEMGARATAAGDGRDPRLGRRLWEAKLWHTLDTELRAADIMRLAQENLAQVSEEIRQAAAELTGGRGDDDTVREALNRLGDEHPHDGSIVELARVTLDEATEFIRSQELVSLVDDACVVVAMPEFARGVAVASCESPGALETADLPTFYWISPTPQGWSPQRVDSFYREYNNHMIRNLTVHEAMPGHFLQSAHARRYVGSTRVRPVARSGPFVEGWAVYAEQVMVEHGFGGHPVRLQQLKMQLRSTLNAILDQLVHCEETSEGEAMALLTQRGFQEEGEASGKWRRALLTSTQLSTYFVGYSEVSAIARARPAATSVRAWHDAMLGHGSPAPRHLRTLLAG